jgi:hypothetical protein
MDEKTLKMFEEIRLMETEGVVDCDDNCGALKDPDTEEEYKAAYEHWRWHGLQSGCSHSR